MLRTARLVCPGIAHHVTQRGNAQQRIFFTAADAKAYVRLIAQGCATAQTRCLAWCLMPNHVHLILMPAHEDGLRHTLGPAHTHYSQRIHAARGSSGHVFQGRFASYPMEDAHVAAAVRYVENNPVTAGLAAHAEDWRWSSARAHVDGVDDGLTDIAALARHIPNWRAYLAEGIESAEKNDAIEHALRTGKPLGALQGTVARGLSPS